MTKKLEDGEQEFNWAVEFEEGEAPKMTMEEGALFGVIVALVLALLVLVR